MLMLRPGITCNEPGKNLDHAFRETLSMGQSLVDVARVDAQPYILTRD